MKIAPLTQLRVEDFPKEQQKWLERLFGPLNSYLTTVTSALQQNLDFSNNFLGQQQTLSFTYSKTTLPLSFKITMSGVPVSLRVCQALENKTPVIVLLNWQYLGGQIQITDMCKVQSAVPSSLVADSSYSITLRLET